MPTLLRDVGMALNTQLCLIVQRETRSQALYWERRSSKHCFAARCGSFAPNRAETAPPSASPSASPFQPPSRPIEWASEESRWSEPWREFRTSAWEGVAVSLATHLAGRV